jgi:hypothetical protein
MAALPRIVPLDSAALRNQMAHYMVPWSILW